MLIRNRPTYPQRRLVDWLCQTQALDEQAAIEQAIRRFFVGPGDSLNEVAPGPLRQYIELTRARPKLPAVEETFTIHGLTIERLEDDFAEVWLDASEKSVLIVPFHGRHRTRHFFRGPMTLRRIAGTWKVEDYTAQGRRRSESLRLRARGSQDVDGLRLETIAVDLQGDQTLIWLRVENRRGRATGIAPNGYLGVRRVGRWKFLPAGIAAVEIGTGTYIRAAVMPQPLPLTTRHLRLILLERNQRVGFDFIIDLDPEFDFEPVQRPPDALPFRLRLQRSPLALVPALLFLFAVLLLGSWPAVGLTLVALGVLMSVSLVRYRRRWGRARSPRPVIVSSLVLGSGVIILALTGLPFGGCPSRSKSRRPADRFALALLTRGPRAAAQEMWSGTEPVQDVLPRVRPVSLGEARGIVRTGRRTTGAECAIPFLPPGVPGVSQPDFCFVYSVPEGVLENSSHTLVVYCGCHSRRWQVDGFGSQ